MLARSKINSIETKTSEALIINEIDHENFMAIISEEKKLSRIKRNTRMMNSQRGDTEKINLIQERKK